MSRVEPLYAKCVQGFSFLFIFIFYLYFYLYFYPYSFYMTMFAVLHPTFVGWPAD